jgi:geranylgeranyl diphosphate synthase type II
MMTGAILAGAGEDQVAAIEKCAYNIGIAFQIQDDILDVIGDSGELGKPTGSDAQNGKTTYVTWKGLEQAKADVEALSREAVAILDGFEGEHEFLKQLVLNLIDRRK